MIEFLIGKEKEIQPKTELSSNSLIPKLFPAVIIPIRIANSIKVKNVIHKNEMYSANNWSEIFNPEDWSERDKARLRPDKSLLQDMPQIKRKKVIIPQT